MQSRAVLRVTFAILAVAPSGESSFVTASPRHDEPGNYRAYNSSEPGPRNAHAMAYDRVRDRVVLFGGADERRVLSDTWEFNGVAWKLVATSGPPARTFPSVAFHDARRSVLLFGGSKVLFGSGGFSRSNLLADLWEWDGTAWKAIAAPGPQPRSEAAMAYDRVRNRLVLFGGYTVLANGSRERLADTWEWDGGSWRQIDVIGPRGRSGLAMTYDGDRGRVVLFGGSTGSPSNETWEWDGTRWLQLPTAPSGRFNPNIVHDGAGRRLLVFGGWTGSRRTAQLDQLEDGKWEAVRTSGSEPAPRNHAAMVYDERRGRVLLFGGHDGELVFGDLWSFANGAWDSLGAAAAKRRIDNGH